MLRYLVLMIIVFNTAPASIAHAQESRVEAVKAHMDSVKAAHLAKAAQLRAEILEKHEAFQKSLEAAGADNVVIINGDTYQAKDSLKIKSAMGTDIAVKGSGNQVLIESNNQGNTVIVKQSGTGNTASVQQRHDSIPAPKKKY
ncbi:hypothetical protein [Belliella pelovolcani]|uniref:hypothetical protein n=1 Tax=Belliella pelovolcani TaxID=529505 RepID=UPI003918B7A9